MNKKSRGIITVVIFILLIILTLWISGIIPKQIAKIYSTRYLKKNFPKIQLEYIDIEWVSSFGDYIIKFKDESDKIYGFVISPKYFPINLGQGMFGFEEEYKEQYNNIPQTYKESNLTFENITDDEAKVELEKDNSIILLDVRTKEEYNEKHIPDSILIPLDELEGRALNELKDKQAKIFVYCRSGVRSITASEILVGFGYENVYNLGGIMDWKYETE